jgi:hypothetical protein
MRLGRLALMTLITHMYAYIGVLMKQSIVTKLLLVTHAAQEGSKNMRRSMLHSHLQFVIECTLFTKVTIT